MTSRPNEPRRILVLGSTGRQGGGVVKVSPIAISRLPMSRSTTDLESALDFSNRLLLMPIRSSLPLRRTHGRFSPSPETPPPPKPSDCSPFGGSSSSKGTSTTALLSSKQLGKTSTPFSLSSRAPRTLTRGSSERSDRQRRWRTPQRRKGCDTLCTARSTLEGWKIRRWTSERTEHLPHLTGLDRTLSDLTPWFTSTRHVVLLPLPASKSSATLRPTYARSPYRTPSCA